jgi:hypothetical protein
MLPEVPRVILNVEPLPNDLDAIFPLKEWVRGDVHTNTVENVWSLLKRSIIGAYHKVSMKHLDRYLDELEHRFNNRNNDYLFRDTMKKLVESDVLTYVELTKAA